ncbi:hypothetical protein G6F50_017096 [Rhizopus delemar]|uniref:Uncharacterized protein n=1 Tax=Rhizopus delemar TaxID=936053 RepID=A0A9P6XS01_9FUNG|nr:hypothetical protein G6F50_017096 [Rhizopus delemar]
MMTLNPVLRVDTQMIEAVQAHHKVSREQARQRALQTLTMVGIPAGPHAVARSGRAAAGRAVFRPGLPDPAVPGIHAGRHRQPERQDRRAGHP